MTGTGLVPPPDFTLTPGDLINISIEGIGTLTNTVGTRPTLPKEVIFLSSSTN